MSGMRFLKVSDPLMSLFKLSLLIILIMLAQYADGNQRIVYVSEFSEDFITSGEDDNSHICCVYGNCSCSSLDHALANLTSNVLINITTNVTLASIIKVSNVENVTIIGHNNPILSCKDFSGIHLTFCHNCFIQGITWDGCGREKMMMIDTEPGLKLCNSSNIKITDCIFQHSKGQAVLMSEVSGDVNINHCNFVHNNQYYGHGATIHYSSSNETNVHQFSVFTISACNFTYNHTKSLVYIENRISKHNNNITFCSAKFVHNQGVSVYAVNQNIYLNGKILFQNNTADYGAGIYVSDHSTVIFSENSTVTFTQNFAILSGGTVFLRNHSKFIFDKNSMATFNDNKAQKGGSIYSEVNSNITFKANCTVTFSHNSAELGGAIFSYNDSCVIFDGNSTALFNSNIANEFGGVAGAIYSYDSSCIIFKEYSSPVFSNNIAKQTYYGGGGAIYSSYDSRIFFEGHCSPLFSHNTAKSHGGAIYSDHNSHIFFEGHCLPLFSDNTAKSHGGAICSDYNSYSFFEGHSSPVFSSNTATHGGALYCDQNSNILFEGNSSPVFSNNNANYGGAIYSNYNSNVCFEGNSSSAFGNNTADHGGAILSNDKSSIYFEENSSPVFNNNTASFGGALCSVENSYVLFEGNSSPVFSTNIAYYGGAIHSGSNSYVLFKIKSSAKFNNNTATNYGGAMYCFTGNITLEGLSDIEFRSNIAENGGAIFADGHCDIILSDNSTVTFTNNAKFVAAVFSKNSKIIAIGNSTVIFNNLTVKWCDNTCLPYTGQDHVVTIDSNGIVWCSDQKAFICVSKNCYCNKLEDLLDGLNKSNTVVNITDTVTLSSPIELENLNNVSIIGYNNITIICVNGGRLHLKWCLNITIVDFTWIGCGSHIIGNAPGPVISIDSSSGIIIRNCTFRNSFDTVIFLTFIGEVTIDLCNFLDNNHNTDYASAIIYGSIGYNSATLTIYINNCNFSYNGNIMYSNLEYMYLHFTYCCINSPAIINNIDIFIFIR